MHTEASKILSGNSYQISQWGEKHPSHTYSQKSKPSQVFPFLANWYLKISSPNVFGLPPTAPYLQQLSKVDVVVHYGNEVNSRADVYRVSCHASSVTAAVPSLVTKRLRCKLSNSPYFHNFLKEKKRTYDEQRKQQPQPRYQDSSIVTVFLVRKEGQLMPVECVCEWGGIGGFATVTISSQWTDD